MSIPEIRILFSLNFFFGKAQSKLALITALERLPVMLRYFWMVSKWNALRVRKFNQRTSRNNVQHSWSTSLKADTFRFIHSCLGHGYLYVVFPVTSTTHINRLAGKIHDPTKWILTNFSTSLFNWIWIIQLFCVSLEATSLNWYKKDFLSIIKALWWSWDTVLTTDRPPRRLELNWTAGDSQDKWTVHWSWGCSHAVMWILRRFWSTCGESEYSHSKESHVSWRQ